MGLGSLISDGIHLVEDVVDPNTSTPAGANPASIYQWFRGRQAPGTPSYEEAANTLQSMQSSLQDYAAKLSQAQQALSAGWTGSAADAAQQSFAPLNQSAQQLATHATDMDTHLTAQISQFNETKSKLVDVPSTPPSGPGLGDFVSMLSPATVPLGVVGIASADTSVSDYQSNAHANQQAYSGYQGPTNSQAAALPQGSTATAPPASVDQSVTAPPTATPVHLNGGAPSARGSYGSVRGSRYSGGYQGGNGMTTSPGANPTIPQVGANSPTNLDPGTTNVQGYTPPSSLTPPTVTNPSGPNPSGPSPNSGGSGGYSPTGGVGSTFGAGGSSGGGGYVGGFGLAGESGGGYGGSAAYGGSGGGYGSSGGGAGSTGSGSRSGVGAVGAEEEEEGGGFGSAAAGANGAVGAPGMAGNGRGGKGEGDSEHKAAAYLQENNPEAIFGTDEKTVPPVIGA